MTDAARTGNRLRIILIEAGIVVVLVAHVAAFVLVRREQRRYDGDAHAIAAWMHEHDETRLAWPVRDREAVPALLGAGVTPVLVDDDAPPQQLAVNDTPIAVTRGVSHLDAITEERLRAGPFTARRIDLDAAAATPLEPGDVVGQEIARPYQYAPIRNSLRLPHGRSLTVPLTLEPGRYRVAVEAFDPPRTAELRVAVRAGRDTIAQETHRLSVLVYHPLETSFTLTGPETRRVTLSLTPVGGTAFVHAWSVTREPEP